MLETNTEENSSALKVETELKRGAMIFAARDLLRAHPDGLTPKRLVRSLMRLKNTPDPIAEKLAAGLLGGLPEFEFTGERWQLACPEPVRLDTVPFVVVDVETTGGRPGYNRLIEVAAFRVIGGRITAGMTRLINPGRPIPLQISYLTGIYDVHVADAPPAEEVMPGFFEFLGDGIFVAHSARFDFGFLNAEAALCGLPFMRNETLCTVKLARRAFPGERSYGLDRMIEKFSIEIDPRERHRGHGDAWAAAKLLILCLERLAPAGITTLDHLLRFTAMPPKQTAAKYNLA